MPELMDWEQLERYFAGELAADDAVQLRRWLMAHPEHAQMLDRVNQELDYVSALGDLDRSDALVSWHTLTARMLGDARTPTVTDGLGTNVTYVENSRAALARQAQSSGDTLRRDVTNPTTNRLSLSRGVSTREKSARPALQGIAVWGTQPLRRLRWYTATVLTSAITVGLVGWLLGWRTPDVPSIALKPVSTYVTGNGERARITLPDSNTVLLDVATRLEVPADYLEGDHVVRVTTGEAVFAVSHHTRTPFTVVTGGVTTRVLGTEFLVRRYPTDTATLVAVREGKVVVQTALRRSLVLSASRQVT
ncbi:MAG TPA: FecR domain-containing protein, partial [Gemmatimonadaceae bacterium]|nr:FecR domain-containing protein [Gemmatimonadaceae bacterium]